jgi:hypothetical protein
VCSAHLAPLPHSPLAPGRWVGWYPPSLCSARWTRTSHAAGAPTTDRRSPC